MGKEKSTADAKDLQKVIRANLQQSGLGQHYTNPSSDVICEEYEEFIVDLLDLSTTINLSDLKKAVKDTLEVSGDEAHAFASSICRAISICKEKKKSVTTGKKQPAAVMNILKKLGAALSPPKAVVVSTRKPPTEASETFSEDKVPETMSQTTLTADAIQKLFGCGSSSSGTQNLSCRRTADSASPISLSSGMPSPEPPAAVAPATMSTSPGHKQFMHSKQKYVRIAGGVVVEEAEMIQGESGFQIARWADGSQTQSEVPNLILEAAAKAKAKADPKKRPAAAKAKAAAKKSRVQGNKPANYWFVSESFGDVKAEFYTDKCYCRQVVDGSFKNIVSCDQGNYHDILQKLVPHIKKANMTKPMVYEIRNKLQAEAR